MEVVCLVKKLFSLTKARNQKQRKKNKFVKSTKQRPPKAINWAIKAAKQHKTVTEIAWTLGRRAFFTSSNFQLKGEDYVGVEEETFGGVRRAGQEPCVRPRHGPEVRSEDAVGLWEDAVEVAQRCPQCLQQQHGRRRRSRTYRPTSRPTLLLLPEQIWHFGFGQVRLVQSVGLQQLPPILLVLLPLRKPFSKNLWQLLGRKGPRKHCMSRMQTSISLTPWWSLRNAGATIDVTWWCALWFGKINNTFVSSRKFNRNEVKPNKTSHFTYLSYKKR